MDKIERKMAKKVAAAIKKELGLKYDVVLVSKSSKVRMYDVLLTDLKCGCYYLYRVLEKSVLTLNLSGKDMDASVKNAKVLYNFFIA